MKLLIITQSNPAGLNRQIANTCAYMVDELHQGLFEYEIKNSSDLDLSTIDLYTHIIMVVPEWNGSFPCTFKSMIDNSGYPSKFKGKKILLIGTSESTFGNIMGISHLKYILEWIGANIYHKLICIPKISESIDHIHGYRDENARVYNSIRNFIK